uniref:E3 ubiquitin-protein ligase n=1 Tax=Petromyzon marinus TaxID=7757 RepID=A0AAJ7TFY8_PETMA|nr:E3 ubiquitin-protein ligase SIAH2-like [Petromyzon marinus]
MSREQEQQQQQQQPKTAGARRCLGGGGGMVPPWRAAWELLSCVTRLRDPRRKRAAAAGGERADRAVAPRLPEAAAPLEAPADANTVAGEAAPSASDRPSGTGSPHAPRRASRPQGKTPPAASRSATPPSAAAVAAVATAHPGTTSKGCSSAPERQSDDPSARPSGLSRLLASALRASRGARPGERPAGEAPAAVPCRHAAAGCSHGAASHAERRAHEQSCDFRPGACPCPGAACPWRGPVRDVKAHLQAAHDTIGTLQGEDIVFLASGVDLPGSASWAMMQSCLGQVFLLVLEKEPAWGAQAELRSEPGKDPREKADERPRGHARPAPAPGHPLRRRGVASPRGRGFVRPQGRTSSWQEAAAPPGRPEVGPFPPPDGRDVAHPGVRRDGGRDGGQVGPAPRPHGAPASGDRTGMPSAPPRAGDAPRDCSGVSLGPGGYGHAPCQQHFLAAVALIGSPEQAEAFSYRLELKAEGARRRRLCWEAPVRSVWDGSASPALAKGGGCLAFGASLACVFTAEHSLAIGVRITKR